MCLAQAIILNLDFNLNYYIIQKQWKVPESSTDRIVSYPARRDFLLPLHFEN